VLPRSCAHTCSGNGHASWLCAAGMLLCGAIPISSLGSGFKPLRELCPFLQLSCPHSALKPNLTKPIPSLALGPLLLTHLQDVKKAPTSLRVSACAFDLPEVRSSEWVFVMLSGQTLDTSQQGGGQLTSLLRVNTAKPAPCSMHSTLLALQPASSALILMEQTHQLYSEQGGASARHLMLA